jgi:hypothetical protein
MEGLEINIRKQLFRGLPGQFTAMIGGQMSPPECLRRQRSFHE